MMQHPQTHLWPALQRRFSDQQSPSIASDRLLRGLAIQPLDGQEESSAYTLGYREVGSVLRTPSLARDFQALAAMVEPTRPCYIAAYVGDVNIDAGGGDGAATRRNQWVLIAYVPSECSSFEAKKMADNRAGLKTGLGADCFGEGGMWAVAPDQISLSHYMRSTDATAGGGGSGGGENGDGSAERGAARSPLGPAEQQRDLAASTIQGAMRRTGDTGGHSKGAAAAAAESPAFPVSAAGAVRLGDAPADATDAIWEERITGVRHAYVDSCSRLVGALEELEQTLCGLTGDEYRAEEPLLRARAHMTKNLELLR